MLTSSSASGTDRQARKGERTRIRATIRRKAIAGCGLPSLVAPVLPAGELPQMAQAAFILALLGSIDTLLTSLVADSITRGRHDADKELVGQGIGNTIAGLLGALPGAGATMRTGVNVRAGGRTPISGMLQTTRRRRVSSRPPIPCESSGGKR